MDSTLRKSIVDYIHWSPISLVVRESCRLFIFNKLTEKYKLKKNARILDVGCGDGRWWNYINDKNQYEVYGIDINQQEIEKAKKVINAKVLDVASDNFRNTYNLKFDLIVGNCSMEHIPDIDSALRNISDACNVDARVIIFVPTPQWALNGKTWVVLNKISPRFSMAFSGAINGFFQHWHLYNYKVWQNLLKEHNLEVVEIVGIGTSRLEFLFRLFLPSAFVAFLVKQITGKYINFFLSFIVPYWIIIKVADHLYKEVINCEVSKESKSAFEYAIVAIKK